MQENREFCGEGGGRCVLGPAGRVKGDPRFRRIGDHKAQHRVARTVQKLFPVAFGIQAAGRGRDHSPALHGLSVLASAQDQRIESVLLGEAVRRFRVTAAGLNQNDLAVEAGLLVHQVDEAVGKRPQKVSFPELYHALRRIFQQIAGITLFFQCCE